MLYWFVVIACVCVRVRTRVTAPTELPILISPLKSAAAPSQHKMQAHIFLHYKCEEFLNSFHNRCLFLFDACWKQFVPKHQCFIFSLLFPLLNILEMEHQSRKKMSKCFAVTFNEKQIQFYLTPAKENREPHFQYSVLWNLLKWAKRKKVSPNMFPKVLARYFRIFFVESYELTSDLLLKPMLPSFSSPHVCEGTTTSQPSDGRAGAVNPLNRNQFSYWNKA